MNKARISLTLLALAAVIGCGSREVVDPAVMSLRQKFLLSAEPPAAGSIAEARKAVESDPAVVLVGRIAAPDVDPFDSGKATFVLSEVPPPGHEKSAGHDADNCPFCKRRKSKAAIAYVQLVDEQGKVLPLDARKLLGVNKDQDVVVRGHGEVNGLGMFLVTADGVYPRTK